MLNMQLAKSFLKDFVWLHAVASHRPSDLWAIFPSIQNAQPSNYERMIGFRA